MEQNLNIVKINRYSGAVVTKIPDPTRNAPRTADAKSGYHHGDLEAALVAEALRLVRERGADAVSLRQVAQAVGVSPSAAYGHFPDKQALMGAVAVQGMAILDERMYAGAGAVAGTDDRAALERFWRTGEAYVGFATDEPHLFRHIFGPYCPPAHEARMLALGGDELADLHAQGLGHKAESGSYQLLCDGLDDLESRGLLRPGVREGLDVVIWTTVHGFSSLVLDGLLPIEVRDVLLASIARLMMADGLVHLDGFIQVDPGR